MVIDATSPTPPEDSRNEWKPNDATDTILAMYKTAVEMADRDVARRAGANNFFLTLNTALAAVVGIVSSAAKAAASWRRAHLRRFRAGAHGIAGIVLALVWRALLATTGDSTVPSSMSSTSSRRSLPGEALHGRVGDTASPTSRRVTNEVDEVVAEEGRAPRGDSRRAGGAARLRRDLPGSRRPGVGPMTYLDDIAAEIRSAVPADALPDEDTTALFLSMRSCCLPRVRRSPEKTSITHGSPGISKKEEHESLVPSPSCRLTRKPKTLPLSPPSRVSLGNSRLTPDLDSAKPSVPVVRSEHDFPGFGLFRPTASAHGQGGRRTWSRLNVASPGRSTARANRSGTPGRAEVLNRLLPARIQVADQAGSRTDRRSLWRSSWRATRRATSGRRGRIRPLLPRFDHRQ